MLKFPIRINYDRGYFEDQNSTPFLWHADTCWRIFWMLPFEDACKYLDKRASQGFTVIQVHLLPHHIYQTNIYGENPFTECGKINSINEEYFRNVDRIIEYAGKLGLAVAIAPMWLSTWEDDWHTLYHGDAVHMYSRTVAERYGAFRNVIAFIHGGDDDSIPLHDEINMCAAIYKKFAPHVLNTFHAGIAPGYPLFGDEEWYDFCFNYTYHYDDCIKQMTEAKKRYPKKPAVLGETHYDGNDGISAQTIRRYAYTSVILGGTGHTYGNKDVWMGSMFFFDSIYSAASHHMMVLKEIFDRIPWYEFRPDYEGKLFRTVWALRQDAEDSIIVASSSKDGREITAYVEDTRFFTVQGVGKYSAEWIDPVSGRSFPFDGECGEKICVLGRNADGSYDWILHINFL